MDSLLTPIQFKVERHCPFRGMGQVSRALIPFAGKVIHLPGYLNNQRLAIGCQLETRKEFLTYAIMLDFQLFQLPLSFLCQNRLLAALVCGPFEVERTLAGNAPMRVAFRGDLSNQCLTLHFLSQLRCQFTGDAFTPELQLVQLLLLCICQSRFLTEIACCFLPLFVALISELSLFIAIRSHLYNQSITFRLLSQFFGQLLGDAITLTAQLVYLALEFLRQERCFATFAERLLSLFVALIGNARLFVAIRGYLNNQGLTFGCKVEVRS